MARRRGSSTTRDPALRERARGRPAEQGLGKNDKTDRVRILFALLATPQGLPAGYELFPGNAREGSTLVQALDALEKRHGDARSRWWPTPR